MINIDSLEVGLRLSAVPVTLEYPGYLCVQYRQAEITIGVDEATVRIQTSYDGIDLPVNYARSIYPSTEMVDIIDELVLQLSLVYTAVDTFIKVMD